MPRFILILGCLLLVWGCNVRDPYAPLPSILDLKQRIDELDRKVTENDFSNEAHYRYLERRISDLENREDLREKAAAKERLTVVTEASRTEITQYRSCAQKGCW